MRTSEHFLRTLEIFEVRKKSRQMRSALHVAQMFSLRRHGYRTVSRIGKAAIPGYRLQSTVPLQPQAPESIADAVTIQEPTPQPSDSTRFTQSKPRPYLHRRVRIVSSQVEEAIASSATDLLEAADMFVDALAYLNEVKNSEGFTDVDIFIGFQSRLAELMEKALVPGVSLGDKSIEDLIYVAAEHGISRQFFWWLMAKHYFETCEDKLHAYRNTLALWVSYLGYMNRVEGPVSTKILKTLGPNYRPYHFKGMAYYAYLETCKQDGRQPDSESAKKLLQMDSVPTGSLIFKTFRETGLWEKYGSDVQDLLKTISGFEIQNMDPNGPVALTRIERAAKDRSIVALDTAYQDILAASKRNNKPIWETTLVRIMDAYTVSGHIHETLRVFQTIVKNRTSTPLIVSWNAVLHALASPEHVKNSGQSHEAIAESFNQTLRTIEANGIAFDADTLFNIVSCYANLNMFDKVADAISKYSNAGNGSLPLTNKAKDAVTIGMMNNGLVLEAEQDLKKNVQQGQGYVPSTTLMNSFLDYYVKQKNYNAAEGILKTMKRLNVSEDVYTYTIIFDFYFKMFEAKGVVPDAESVMKKLQKSGEDLSEQTYSALINGLTKNGLNMEAARQVFAAGTAKYPRSTYLYSSIMRGELVWGLIGIAEEVFERYLRKVGNDSRVWNTFISCLLFKNEDLAMQYYERFKAVGATSAGRNGPNMFTFYYLLRHFKRRSDKGRTQYVLDELASSNVSDLGGQIPAILKELQREYTIPEALRKRMRA